MSYQVLARKWRPRRFADVVGQEHVVRALNNALARDRLHHAYLFSGTRGVGKTTLARIFAKSLNCEQGVSAEPCGRCSVCQEVDEGRFVDLIEVDAASRTKVDQTRDLLDNVPYAPVRGRYKVYLIDEVHMFSGHSFNALLKTLEEPPPHVKFLLATTDPQKLPVTILSRCLQFNLKRLLPTQIGEQMRRVLEQEKVEFEEGAVQLLAKGADGSMRDGLSLLDQAIAFGAGRVGEADVRSMLGSLSADRVVDLAAALAGGDGARVLDLVGQMAEHGIDFEDVLSDLLALLHRIAVGQVVPGSGGADDPDAVRERALSQVIAPQDVQLYYQIGLLGRRDLALAPDARTGIEMVLLRMLAFRPAGTGPTEESPTPRARAVARAVSPGPDVSAASEIRPATALPLAADGDWQTLVSSLGLGGVARQLADNCELESWDGERLCLRLDPACENLRVTGAEERLTKALAERLGGSMRLVLRVAAPESETPAQREARRRGERLEQARRDMAGDPLVKALQEGFDASLIPESIKPVDP
jgi:DNA polymerase-3 subunit gamma/tau